MAKPKRDPIPLDQLQALRDRLLEASPEHGSTAAEVRQHVSDNAQAMIALSEQQAA